MDADVQGGQADLLRPGMSVVPTIHTGAAAP